MIDSNIITERGCGGGRRPDAQGPDIKIFLTTLFFVFRSVAVSAECAAVKGQLCPGVPCPAAAGSCVNIKIDWSDDEEQERARVGTRGQTAQTAPALTGENYLFMMQTTDCGCAVSGPWATSPPPLLRLCVTLYSSRLKADIWSCSL